MPGAMSYLGDPYGAEGGVKVDVCLATPLEKRTSSIYMVLYWPETPPPICSAGLDVVQAAVVPLAAKMPLTKIHVVPVEFTRSYSTCCQVLVEIAPGDDTISLLPFLPIAIRPLA